MSSARARSVVTTLLTLVCAPAAAGSRREATRARAVRNGAGVIRVSELDRRLEVPSGKAKHHAPGGGALLFDLGHDHGTDLGGVGHVGAAAGLEVDLLLAGADPDSSIPRGAAQGL